MSGCPVDAYTKDAATGIVLHSADTCIGCQYCTWNCSYGVPQYNPERGVVGKCDLCHSRLGLGQSPACVSACPTGAIQVEIVKIDDWRAAVAAAAPGLPVGRSKHLDHTNHAAEESAAERTSRRSRAPGDRRAALAARRHDGADAALGRRVRHDLAAATARRLRRASGAASLTSLLVGGLALAASTLHLGRPAYAYRALKMWKRSWLSREVLLFTAFSVVACVYAGVALDAALRRARRGRVDRRAGPRRRRRRARTSIECRRGPRGTRRSRSCSSS